VFDQFFRVDHYENYVGYRVGLVTEPDDALTTTKWLAWGHPGPCVPAPSRACQRRSPMR
jgi:hypothetical protein